MAYNRKLLSLAGEKLDNIRLANESEHGRRVQLVYSKVPEIAQIDNRLTLQMTDLARLIMKGHSVDSLRDSNLDLQIKKAELLVANGFPKDFLEDIYSCPICKDTGRTEKGICSCLDKLYNIELSRELSTLLKTGDESFSNFNLSLYPVEFRAHMNSILNECKDFVGRFPEVNNLLFSGAPGLGKTFMSACIAREIAEQGWSVCYDSVLSAFDTFDKYQFKGDESAEERVNLMLSCDLLILDDLGTEVSKPSNTSALYSLINGRINSGKAMIISTNLSSQDISKRYTDAIVSRLNGCFLEFVFAGDDIRQKIK